jgi:predicted AlkP superfamily phosphohydrolase/phosphomutase
MMRSQRADVAFAVFGETHVAGHYLWSSGLQDATTRLDPSPMLTVYQALDRAIGQVQAAAGEGATIVVISGDCVGPNHAGWHLLPEVLARLGFLATPQTPPADGGGPASTKKFDPVKSLRDLLPKDFRKSLARKLPTKLRDKLAKRVDTADIDWNRTRAYWLPTDLEGCIRVNLKGREPQGTVAPGAEYEQVLAELATELGALRDAQTGRPIVREIIRTDRDFPGQRAAYLPDLIVRWDDSAPIMAARSPRVGTVSSPSPDNRPGTHRGPGFIVASGPGIPCGAHLHGGHILDFAPSLIARLGVAVPNHMRGRVWSELTTA